jgi:hypothetical protein
LQWVNLLKPIFMKERGEFELSVGDGKLDMQFRTPEGCPGPGAEGPAIITGGIGAEYKGRGAVENRAKRNPEDVLQEGDMLLRIGRKPVKHHDDVKAMMDQAVRPVVLTFKRPVVDDASTAAETVTAAAAQVVATAAGMIGL